MGCVRRGSRGLRWERNRQKPVVFQDAGASIDMQADLVAREIHEQKPHVWILRDVSQARHHAVASIFGIRKGSLVQNSYKTWQARPESDIRFALSVGCPNKHHFLATDERLHERIQIVENLFAIKGLGACGRAACFLQIVLSGRTGEDISKKSFDSHKIQSSFSAIRLIWL